MLTSVDFKILDPRLRDGTFSLPQAETDHSAGFDLRAMTNEPLELAAGSPAVLIPTGIAIHIADPDWAGFIVPRSSRGHKHGLVLGNGTGVIDADYQGPLMVSAWNRNPPGGPSLRIEVGERIAQLLFLPVARPRFTPVEDFATATTRGSGGFGSTGR